MSEVWTTATLCFDNKEKALSWENAFRLSTTDWALARTALSTLGLKSVNLSEGQGFQVSKLALFDRRIELSFMELEIDTQQIINELTEAGATHVRTSSDDSRTGSVSKICLIGKTKVKEAEFIAAVSEFDDIFAFIEAIQKGKTAEVKRLLAKGVSPDTNIRTHLKPIHLAAWRGRKAIVKLLIAAGANINVQTGKGRFAFESERTPLHMAIGTDESNPAVVEMLINAGPDVNIKNGAGETTLSVAIQYRNELACRLLLELGADPYSCDAEGKPALFKMSLGGEDSISEFLIFLKEAGLNLDFYSEEYGNFYWNLGYKKKAVDTLESFDLKPRPPQDAYIGDFLQDLNTAIKHHDINKVEDLIATDGNLNTPVPPRHDWGSTQPVICEAAGLGYADIVKRLIDAECDVNGADEGGFTALHKGAFRGHMDVVKLLVENGADVNAVEPKNMDFGQKSDDAMLRALDKGHIAIAQYLLPKWKPTISRLELGITHLEYLANKPDADKLTTILLDDFKLRLKNF